MGLRKKKERKRRLEPASLKGRDMAAGETGEQKHGMRLGDNGYIRNHGKKEEE